MSENELAHLIKMANQIAANIGIGSTEEEIVGKVENHINLFWARPMREKICANMDTYKDDLNSTTIRALTKVKAGL